LAETNPAYSSPSAHLTPEVGDPSVRNQYASRLPLISAVLEVDDRGSIVADPVKALAGRLQLPRGKVGLAAATRARTEARSRRDHPTRTDPAKQGEHSDGVRKVNYVDPGGDEIAFGRSQPSSESRPR